MNRAGLAIIAIGIIAMGLSGVIPLSGLNEQQSCLAIYGIDPSVVQSQGTQLTAQQYFNAQVADPTFAGFGPWQGPVTETKGLNPGATAGASWGATPTGEPLATTFTLPDGYIAWTNPNGGPLATIGWENTIYSLGPGTYSYTGGQAILTKTMYYDLSLYISGTCAQVYNTPNPPTISTTTTASTTTTTTTASASGSPTSSAIGTPTPPVPPNYPVFFVGLALVGVGAFVTVRRRRQ